MDLTHQGNAIIIGDAKAHRIIVIDEDGNEVMDIGALVEDLLDRVVALENLG